MDFKRLAKHLFFPRGFPKSAIPAIEQAIAKGEAAHRGEIRFAVEDALDGPALLAGESARERAVEVFAQLHVWDTEENNGVLIYLLLADHDIEIVADRGINARVAKAEWEKVCRDMEQALARGAYQQAIVTGIEEVSALLARHYPPRPGDRDELPNKAVML
ncbi:MAG TPA: TPM domain-containing protein [Burkholderiales bacterium]|nr:TPM domain-containing protein [Burkholderiales bacterium]